MLMLGTFVFLLAVCTAIVSSRPDNSTDATITVNLEYAQYQGVFDEVHNVTKFLGVRYAAPPTGNLRWRAPHPPAHTAGVQQAYAQPPQCLQGTGGLSPTNPFLQQHGLQRRSVVVDPNSSEDCLFLSVYLPGGDISNDPLPTVVWIHGGGYVGGNASMYDGTDLVLESKNGLVVVTIQYRLGLYGFLPGSQVKGNGDLNVGLLDQNFALRWVNAHISKFGGDPTQVTIWGESAGAGSVLQHVVAENGRTSPQLFRAAITSSSFLPSQYSFDDPVPESLYSEVVEQANCSSTSDSLACLRAADVGVLQNANLNVGSSGFYGTFFFVPVVDGTFITQRPTLSLKQGKVNGEALLAVTNTDEGLIFVNQTSSIDDPAAYCKQLFPDLGSEQCAAVAEQYTGLGTARDQINSIMGDSIFICPSYYLLEAFPNRSFKGEFAIPPATHGEDVTSYFPFILGLAPAFNNSQFLASFSGSFLSFVISLDPNEKIDSSDNITPHWNAFAQGHTEMVFNKTADTNLSDIHPIAVDPGLLERCKFWESLGEFTAQ